MKRKLLTTLFGLLIVGPSVVLAQPTNVNLDIYGVADLTVDNVKAEGSSVTTGTPDKPARYRLDSNSSHLGFRGSAGLMGDMRGIFQYETTVTADQSAIAGTTSASGLFSSARDSYVGVSFANVGSVKLGILSAAGRWINGIGDYSPGFTGINDDQGITAHTGGTTGKNASFNTRHNTAVGVQPPSWGELSARGYSGSVR